MPPNRIQFRLFFDGLGVVDGGAGELLEQDFTALAVTQVATAAGYAHYFFLDFPA
jgi:hypothetical protein